VCVYIYRYMRICMYTCIYHMYVCMYIRIYMHTYICIYVHMYVCLSVCLSFCLSVCVYRKSTRSWRLRGMLHLLKKWTCDGGTHRCSILCGNSSSSAKSFRCVEWDLKLCLSYVHRCSILCWNSSSSVKSVRCTHILRMCEWVLLVCVYLRVCNVRESQ
jgi:hypothetical protein